MNRNLRIYEHEAERSHSQEAVVASAWAFLIVSMVAASLLDWSSRPVASASLRDAATLSSAH
jgi:hypothetical protein